MPFTILRQDITKMKFDAIVNAANTDLAMGGGVCGAIFKAAGIEDMKEACKKLAPIKTGEAVVTPGFRLPVKYVIHTAGPVYGDGKSGEEGLLRASYRNSFKRALENNCESLAFPLISSGIYGYPKDQALEVARTEVGKFLNSTKPDVDIYLAVFDKSAFTTSQKLLGEIKSYIDQHYVDARVDLSRINNMAGSAMVASAMAGSARESAENLAFKVDESFSKMLLRLIDEKGYDDVKVYKAANLDRKLFSKIRTNNGYRVSKNTALALAISLQLSIGETREFLARAGYALSPSQLGDVIIQYFIEKARYDIYEINEMLFDHDQTLLGS